MPLSLPRPGAVRPRHSTADSLVRATAKRAALPLALGLLAAAIGACSSDHTTASVLQPEDLQPPDGATFDPNAIVDANTLTDGQSIAVDDLQKFFQKTPYKKASFLETYQSNGVRAVDAIARASQTYGINPIVFLVRAEADQGLIGAPLYPAPPSRVEYAFGCGCPGQGACDPALAGFDRQVDCLARALRKSLDELDGPAKATAGGWAPGTATRTLDGVDVTPADEGTAALYQYAPVVGVGSGGNWLFWVLFQKYAEALNYTGPLGASGASAWVGDACRKSTDCAFSGGSCQTGYPGGFCTRACNPQSCPSLPSRVPTVCASFGGTGFCAAVCDPNVPASCRTGYECRLVEQAGTTNAPRNVCVPR